MIIAVVLIVAATQAALAGTPPEMEMTTLTPEGLTTPDKVETRIGTLEFFDGFPTEATAQKCFDYPDFIRVSSALGAP